MNNNEKFRTELEKILIDLFKFDPGYSFVAERTTPQILAAKMTRLLPTKEASKEGKAVPATCKILGIKCTYKAIAAYLNA